jgi:preprotein translocase subunit SecE
MNDEAKVQTSTRTGADKAQLLVAILLVAAGITGYYVLQGRPQAWLPWVSLAGGFLLGIVVFAMSGYGRAFWQFVLDSRIELRKVYWPNRQETMTTTMIVFVFVAIASTFFWVLDLILASVTKYFTGQGS